MGTPTTAEFVELYDGGVGNVSLTGYIVVFFNGSDDNDGSYLTIDLTGNQTDANGFFVLGNPGVTPASTNVFQSNTLQNGADAVALYFAAIGGVSERYEPDNDQSARRDRLQLQRMRMTQRCAAISRPVSRK